MAVKAKLKVTKSPNGGNHKTKLAVKGAAPRKPGVRKIVLTHFVPTGLPAFAPRSTARSPRGGRTGRRARNATRGSRRSRSATGTGPAFEIGLSYAWGRRFPP